MDHGVSTYPQDGEQREQLIRVADERLYGAKQNNHRQGRRRSRPAECGGAATDRSGEAPKSAPSRKPSLPSPAEPPIEMAATPQPLLLFPSLLFSGPHRGSTYSSASPIAKPVSPLQTSQPSFPVASEEPDF